MQNIYRLNANELDQSFLDSLKAKFKDQDIEIIINPIDETDYLMASEVNRTRLLKAVENIKQRSQLVEVTLDNVG
jgi:antitoxin YefM